ncbi:hypothetical protein MLD38_040516 [Melastoma candidum]|nr:hypothetical protein MLD38_040516 [Melastoma candidum]
MPQLDQFTYFTQFFWLCLFLFSFYIFICNDRDGVLGISRILKLRNQLVSHQGKNIRSKDPKSLEDILRKGFSTGRERRSSLSASGSQLAYQLDLCHYCFDSQCYQMAGLDPTGDWMGRGAIALANPRTATGEESLEKLYEKWEDLSRGGVRS